MGELNQIIPRSGEVRPGRPYQTPDRRWEQVTEEIYGSTAAAENIAFASDPHWRTRLFSIQSAHDRGHWFWEIAWQFLLWSALHI